MSLSFIQGRIPIRCPGLNEIYGCGTPCQYTCDTLDEPCLLNTYVHCFYACYCYEGYARNESNICIPMDQCP